MDNTEIDNQLSEWIDAHRSEIAATTQALLRIPSVEGEAAPGAPFGIETRQALDNALAVADAQGLTTKNLDGYAAHAEWAAPNAAAAPIVGVLAHVDVVPPGTGWSHPPFGAEIEGGKIYARGAMDDKGPAMAGLWAIVALKACAVPLSHRVRLILGANEESGFGCVKHYFAHEEMPVTGFTPDAMFPLVYAEKGIANAVLTREAFPEGERIHILSLSGGERPNMVPDTAEAFLEGSLPRTAAAARLNTIVGITTEEIGDDNRLRVVAKGVSAHGSTPNNGVNAVAVLCDALLMLDHQEDQVTVIEQIKRWAADTKGEHLGIAGSDDIAGPLTCNLGIAEIANGNAKLTFNIRYPVTWNSDTLKECLLAGIDGTGWTLKEMTDQPPLYVPQDDPLVATLLEVYRAETGDMKPPQTMGGGTYARAMTKGVAFGANFPDQDMSDGGPHEKDECWPIDHLIRATKIYAKALARLAA